MGEPRTPEGAAPSRIDVAGLNWARETLMRLAARIPQRDLNSWEQNEMSDGPPRTTEAELRERFVILSSAAHRLEALCFAEEVYETPELREAAYRLRFVLNHGRLPKEL